jgi:hypothetical protein
MPNRTQEENDAIILNALRIAGAQGMTLEAIKIALFGDGNHSNSLVKKMLERLKQKGHLCIKNGRMSLYYVILSGH